MTTVVYVPRDSSAVSLGADAVAEAIRTEASSRQLDVKIVRNGSRGMFSHEPMVEVAAGAGRIAYGPVAASDVASMFDASGPRARSLEDAGERLGEEPEPARSPAESALVDDAVAPAGTGPAGRLQ